MRRNGTAKGSSHVKIRLLVTFLLTALLLLLAAWGLDFQSVKVCLGRVAWWTFLPMGALFLGSHALRSWRLQLLIGTPISFMRVLAVNSVGYLAINALPLRIGEVVRPWLLKTRDGVSVGASLAAILMERIVDLGVLLLMLVLSGRLLAHEGAQVQVVVQGVDVLAVTWRIGAVGLGSGLILAFGVLVLGDRLVVVLERVLGHVSKRLASTAATSLSAFREGFLALVRAPLRLLGVAVSSVAIWASTLLAFWVVLSFSEAGPFTLPEALFAWAITLAGMTAVPTPGFVGSFEAACSWALRWLGVPAETALALALVLHAGQVLFTLAVGAPFTVMEGLSPREIVRRSREALED
jgi:glycosyltransferase 2 family protein